MQVTREQIKTELGYTKQIQNIRKNSHQLRNFVSKAADEARPQQIHRRTKPQNGTNLII